MPLFDVLLEQDSTLYFCCVEQHQHVDLCLRDVFMLRPKNICKKAQHRCASLYYVSYSTSDGANGLQDKLDALDDIKGAFKYYISTFGGMGVKDRTRNAYIQYAI